MLINIDGERNKKVEELLNEGMSFIQNNISNYKKPSNSKTEINTKSINYENYSIENYNEYNKTINNANKINNTNEYIYYNGQNTELINNTIQALNTGLNYLEKNNINNLGEKKKNYFLKRAQKKLITKKENISKNINDKKIDLKTKLINKVKTPINKGIKKKSFEKIYSSTGYNNNLVSEINYKTLDKLNPSLNLVNNIKPQNQKDRRYLTYNKLYKRPLSIKQKNNLELKEKYQKLVSEYKSTIKQINEIKNENDTINERINEVKMKFDNLNKIRKNNLNTKKENDELRKRFTYSENIKIRQINLIQKISQEIENLKQLLNYNNY